MEELVAAWAKIPNDYRKALEGRKDQLKAAFSGK